jgi:catechol 2,3-dioxygenase-like lactoylglutathione lyase family enzyme
MSKSLSLFFGLICVCWISFANPRREGEKMELGNFSSSLAVKDVVVSKAFYEKLGFTQIAGDIGQHWVIMKSGDTKIGLFQGMFERNALTFNPGWDNNGNQLQSFKDVREIQKQLLESGIELTTKADPESNGPAHIAFVDPDGNPILIDQHVSKP